MTKSMQAVVAAVAERPGWAHETGTERRTWAGPVYHFGRRLAGAIERLEALGMIRVERSTTRHSGVNGARLHSTIMRCYPVDLKSDTD